VKIILEKSKKNERGLIDILIRFISFILALLISIKYYKRRAYGEK